MCTGDMRIRNLGPYSGVSMLEPAATSFCIYLVTHPFDVVRSTLGKLSLPGPEKQKVNF